MDGQRLKETKRPESPERIQAMFSSVAKRYDLANSLMSFGLHYRWKRYAVARTGITNGDSALDVCAGTNDIAIMMAKIVGKSGHVTALDFNADMLEVGKLKAARAGVADTISPVIGDAHDLPFQDNQFNAVTIAVAARHLDLSKAFAEFYRVLKPGGRFVCLEFFQPPNPVFKRLYDFYSYTVMPRVGTIATRDRTGVYFYLPDSIRVFPAPAAFAKLMEEAGFMDVEFARLTGGIVCVHSGEKRPEN